MSSINCKPLHLEDEFITFRNIAQQHSRVSLDLAASGEFCGERNPRKKPHSLSFYRREFLTFLFLSLIY